VSLIKCAVPVIVLILATQTADAQDPLKALKSYLKQNNYETLTPPRANVVVGSVVTFNHHQETIVSSKCLPIDKVPASTPQAIGLTTHTGTYTRNVGIDATFTKAADIQIDVSGAFTDNRVETVSITFTDPTETHLESQDVKQYISHIKSADPCFATLSDKGNIIYQTLVRVDKTSYSFADKTGKTIKLDLNLLKALKISPNYSATYDGKDTLELSQPIYIGYRAWKVNKLPGAVAPSLGVSDLNRDAIVAMKSK
jgi:hypothetical protein